MIETKLLISALLGIIGMYVLYRVFFSSEEGGGFGYDKEFEDILSKDEYKVKGRFD